MKRVDRQIKKPILEIHLVEPQKKGTLCEIQIAFNGIMWESAEGLFRGSYIEKGGNYKKFIATHFRPNGARRMFPCFDEPEYKVPFNIKIARPKTMHTLFTTPLKKTTVM